MENFLRTHEELLELIKGESTPSARPETSEEYREDQLAFKNHYIRQLQLKEGETGPTP